LIDTLKGQIKTLEGSVREKDQKINELKKNMKVTKLDECRVQLEVAEAESLRLRRALDELIRIQEDQRQMLEHSREQEIEMKKLKRQNNELYNALNAKMKQEGNITPKSISNKQKKDKITKLTSEVNELKAKLNANKEEELDYSVEGESKKETIQRLKTRRQKHEELEIKHSKEKDKITKRIQECNC